MQPDWSSYLKNRGPIDIDSVVVHHLHNGNTKVATDAKGDAESQTTEDGDDVALRQTTTATVQQWGRTWCWCHWTPILRQFNIVLFCYIATIYFPKKQIGKNAVRPRIIRGTSQLLSGCFRMHHFPHLFHYPESISVIVPPAPMNWFNLPAADLHVNWSFPWARCKKWETGVSFWHYALQTSFLKSVFKEFTVVTSRLPCYFMKVCQKIK